MGFFRGCYFRSQCKIGGWVFWDKFGANRGGAKFFLPGHPAALQSLLNRLNDRFSYCCRIAKTHFALCRVNIDVDSRGIELQEEKRNRILAFHQSRMITLSNRSCE